MSAKSTTHIVHDDADAGSSQSQRVNAIDQLIRPGSLRAVFQPIIDLSRGDIIGYEALVRPAPESGIHGPAEAFDLAAQAGVLWELEEAARVACVNAAINQSQELLLFFNTSPRVFIDLRYEEAVTRLISNAGLAPARVVLEITERAEDPHSDALREQTQRLKRCGFQVAIDDVGAGASGLRRMMALRPQWLKLDRDLIDGVDTDPYKQNLLDFFVHFARMSGVNLIAEGVERIEELATLIDLGIVHAQGYLLGRPASPAPTLETELAEWIRARYAARRQTRRGHAHAQTVHDAMRPPFVREAQTSATEVARDLLAEPRFSGLVVVDGRRCCGWISRDDALRAAVTTPYIAIGELTRLASPTVDPTTPLSDVLSAVASREESDLLEPTIVAQEGKVLGIISLRDLLRAGAQVATGNDVHLTPLTGMPDRLESDRRIITYIARGAQVDAAFIDIRDFGAFNNRFGPESGDLLLRILSGALSCGLGEQAGDTASMVAHLGDDRFLLIKHGGEIEKLVASVIDEFEHAADRFLGFSDQPLDEADPSDDPKRNPSTDGWGLRVCLVNNFASQVDSPRELHLLAAQLRGRNGVRRGARSTIIRERRTPPANEIAQRRSA